MNNITLLALWSTKFKKKAITVYRGLHTVKDRMAGTIRRYVACLEYMDKVFESRPDGGYTETDAYLYYHFRYVSSLPRMGTVNAIIMLQSPYGRYIYPEMASAASFNPLMTAGTFQEIPATVEVIANDLNVVCDMPRSDVVEWFQDSWMFTTDGIIVINAVHTLGRRTSVTDREMVATIRMLYEIVSSFRSTSPVQVFAMGRFAANAADKLRAAIDRSVTKVTVRTTDHPAAISRKHPNLSSLECTLGVKSFSRALYKVIEMSSKRGAAAARLEQERKALRDDLDRLSASGSKVSSTLSEFIAALEGSGTDTIPVSAVVKLMSHVATSMGEMAMAAKNVRAFERYIQGESTSQSNTGAPNMDNFVESGRLVETSSAPSIPLPSRSSTVSAAEIIRRRRNAATSGTVTEITTQHNDRSEVGSTTPSMHTATDRGATIPVAPQHRPPPSVGSTSASALRAARQAQRRTAQATQAAAATATTVDGGTKITESEAAFLSAISEIMLQRPDGNTGPGEEISSDITTRKATNPATIKALSIVRKEISTNASYDAVKELGMVSGTTPNITGPTYQFCMNYPANEI